VSERENFIARWSRRKRAAAETAGSPPPCGEGLGVGVAESGTAVVTRTTPLPSPPPQGGREQSESAERLSGQIQSRTAPAVDLAKLPPIESITAESDVRAFLAPGIPPELTRAALRRAWAGDPRIRDFVGLSENSWDFNSPDAIGGFGPLEMTHELRQQIAQFVGRNIAATSDEAASSAKAVNDERAAVEVAAASDAASGDAPALENSAALAEPGHAGGQLSDSACIATQSEQPPDRTPAPAKRPHGGALPK
jgi:Protein of unknown function (DUF3306)